MLDVEKWYNIKNVGTVRLRNLKLEMKFHNNVPRGGNCLLDREYSAEEDSRRNWSSTDEKMSSSESPSSVMIYVQSLILLSLSYSYFSYYGWFTLDRDIH